MDNERQSESGAPNNAETAFDRGSRRTKVSRAELYCAADYRLKYK